MKRVIGFLLPVLLASCHSGSETQCINELADDPACELDKTVSQSLPALDAGSLTSGATTDTTLTVSWSPAVGGDNCNLWYLAVATEKKETIESLEALKAAIVSKSLEVFRSEEWTKDITSATIKDLTPGTTYKVTVLVRNRAGKITSYNIIDLTTDSAAAGSSGAPSIGTPIVTSAIQPWSMSLSWGAATSPTSESLSYKVVFAASADLIDTVEEVESMASSGVLKDWTKDLLTTEATQLAPETAYSFAVLVKDASGRKALYAVKTEATAAAPAYLTMFITDNTLSLPFATGEETWAAAADAKCDADPKSNGSTFKALLVGSTRRACATPNCSGDREGMDWVLHANQEYRLHDDSTVIGKSNAKALMPNPLTNSFISHLAISQGWSGLNTDWTTGDNCSNWATSDAASTPTWQVESVSNYLSGSGACSTQKYLICVGQSAPAPDTAAPTPGADISLVTRTASSLNIAWGAGTDDRTPTNALKYKLVWATDSTSIDTVEEVDQMASNILLNWGTSTTYSHTGRSSATTYHYAVLVKDRAGKLALYAPKNFTTLAAPKKIFVTQGSWAGDMEAPVFAGFAPSPLDLADANCMGDAHKPSGGGTYKAMIAHPQRQACSSADCTASSTGRVGWIFSASTSYARPDGTPIGTTDANAVLTFPLSAGLDPVEKAFASGFNSAWGMNPAFNCSNWTDSTSERDAGWGSTSATSSVMLEGDATPCTSPLPLVCVEQ